MSKLNLIFAGGVLVLSSPAFCAENLACQGTIIGTRAQVTLQPSGQAPNVTYQGSVNGYSFTAFVSVIDGSMNMSIEDPTSKTVSTSGANPGLENPVNMNINDKSNALAKLVCSIFSQSGPARAALSTDTTITGTAANVMKGMIQDLINSNSTTINTSPSLATPVYTGGNDYSVQCDANLKTACKIHSNQE